MVAQGETEDVVNQYLNIAKDSSELQGCDHRFEDEPKKEIQIRRIKLVDGDEKEIQHLDNRRAFTTQIEVDMKEFKEGTEVYQGYIY